MDYLASLLQGKFYAARLHDRTGIVIDPQDYADDLSLKGLFVNQVLQSELEEDEKQRVLSLGLHLMLGGEVNVLPFADDFLHHFRCVPSAVFTMTDIRAECHVGHDLLHPSNTSAGSVS